jgi:uncharacterized membrane protein
MMINRLSEASVVAAVASVAAFVTTLPIGAAMRTMAAAPLVLYLPGHAILSAIFPHSPINVERTVFAAGLSMTVTIMCGMVLHCMSAMTSIGWAASLHGITIAACVIAHLRSPSTMAAPWNWSRCRVGGSQFASVGFALALTLAAVDLARQGALAHREYSFTEFWMVPATANNQDLLTIGLESFEKAPASYDIEVTIDGVIFDLWRSIALAPGERWTADLSVDLSASPPKRVQALLYKDGSGGVYRKVWFDPVPAGTRQSVYK